MYKTFASLEFEIPTFLNSQVSQVAYKINDLKVQAYYVFTIFIINDLKSKAKIVFLTQLPKCILKM